LGAIALSSPADGWIGGSGGTLLHWDGNSWSLCASPTTTNIRAIDMLAPDNGWAIGGDSAGHSAILHWNGTQWQLVTEYSDRYIYDLDLLSATDGWAVGTLGDIWHWNGSILEWIDGPVMHDLYEVRILAPNDGWAIGGDWASFDSSILHWNGVAWSVIAEVEDILNDLDFVSPTNGWAVGQKGTIMRWDGTRWQVEVAPGTSSPALLGISMVSGTSGWAVGGRETILRWNGSQWRAFVDWHPTNWIHLPLIMKQ
jgi:photosystem II stability/assembly factor-like uncharacterized protein